MKVSKSLLQAIAVGLTIGAAGTSCDSIKESTEELHLSTCDENCTIDHSGKSNNETTHYNCPGCGMG